MLMDSQVRCIRHIRETRERRVSAVAQNCVRSTSPMIRTPYV
jgi:hypothetical protein